MSLIAVAQRVWGSRTLTRNVLTVLIVAVGIIAGLLAMHSFNSHATAVAHHDSVTVGAHTVGAHTGDMSEQHPAPSTVAVTPGTASQEPGCATCGGDQDAMTWMACVLALLVATILLGRVGLSWRRTPPSMLLAIVMARWPARACSLPPPPSLTVLCISRT